jgi:hypothetical protein
MQSKLHFYPDTFTIVPDLPPPLIPLILHPPWYHITHPCLLLAIRAMPANRQPSPYLEATPTCLGRPPAVTKNNRWLLIAKYLQTATCAPVP